MASQNNKELSDIPEESTQNKPENTPEQEGQDNINGPNTENRDRHHSKRGQKPEFEPLGYDGRLSTAIKKVAADKLQQKQLHELRPTVILNPLQPITVDTNIPTTTSTAPSSAPSVRPKVKNPFARAQIYRKRARTCILIGKVYKPKDEKETEMLQDLQQALEAIDAEITEDDERHDYLGLQVLQRPLMEPSDFTTGRYGSFHY